MRLRFFVAATLFAAFGASAAHPQENRFKGQTVILDVPTTQKSAACAIRYAPPGTAITITDLDPRTPLDIKPCDSSVTVRPSGDGKVVIRTTKPDTSWCFTGEDTSYRIDFQGDEYSGPVSYLWFAERGVGNGGFLNLRDFGAKGDGRTDDTLALRSALAYSATRNGSVLKVPEGDYLVGSQPGFRPLVLPSGVTLEGVTGLHSGASTNNVVKSNPSRIRLAAQNAAIFRIGECTEQIVLKDLELIADSQQNTMGIEAVGAFLSAQSISLERVVFNSFFRGFVMYGLPQTSLNWQADYVKVEECRFIYNTDAGIYTNIANSNWRVEGSLFINPKRTPTQAADSMHFERVGMVLVEDTFGGGFASALGGAFIKILDSASLTIIGSETESMTESLVYNAPENPYAGDYSYPITVVNSIFGAPLIFKARRNFVSTGSMYGADTFNADERVRVYSTGDRFCYDGYKIGCKGAAKKNFDRATVVFLTGQPSDGNVAGHPTYFGTDVEFGAPLKLPAIPFGSLPANKPDGSMVFCPDCRRNTTQCQGGGSGAPAMVVNGEWSCL